MFLKREAKVCSLDERVDLKAVFIFVGFYINVYEVQKEIKLKNEGDKKSTKMTDFLVVY